MPSEQFGEAIVQIVAVTMQDHVVRKAIQLLKREVGGVAVVDLRDGVAKCGPCVFSKVRVHLRGLREGGYDEAIGASSCHVMHVMWRRREKWEDACELRRMVVCDVERMSAGRGRGRT